MYCIYSLFNVSKVVRIFSYNSWFPNFPNSSIIQIYLWFLSQSDAKTFQVNKTLKHDVIKQLGVSMIINPKCNVQLGFLRRIMTKIHKLRMRSFRGWNIEFNKEVEQKKKRQRSCPILILIPKHT